MRPHHLALLACALSLSSALRILVYNPKFAHSHVNFLGRVADILVEAGHSVTTLMPVVVPEMGNGTHKSEIIFVAPNPEAVTNYKIISDTPVDFFTTDYRNPIESFKIGIVLARAFAAQCGTTMESGVADDLRTQKFDVYIVETFDPCGILMAELIKPKSVILQSTLFLWMHQLDGLGIDRTLSYNPSVYSNELDVKCFWSRFMNVFTDYVTEITQKPMHSACEQLFKDKYGPDFPGVREQTSRVTFAFTNSEPLYDFAVPTLSKVIAVPGLGAKEPQPLDEFWTEVLSRRPKTVLISFGSIAKPSLMQPAFKEGFLKMFNAFPNVTFIFKFDPLTKDEDKQKLLQVPNVVPTPWMPQNDLLHDPRLTLFITHCGMGSAQELTMAGKPGVFIPLFFDQKRNCLTLEHAGVGVRLWKGYVADPEKFIGAVKDALENDKYQKRATEIKHMLAGKPFSSRELLVKHVDFAGKYGEVAVNRPWSHDMNWVEYHNADVWLFIVSAISLITLLVIYLTIRLIRCVCIRYCGCAASDSSDQVSRPTAWSYSS